LVKLNSAIRGAPPRIANLRFCVALLIFKNVTRVLSFQEFIFFSYIKMN